MKKYTALLTVLAFAFYLLAGCSNNSPSEPASPTATPTITAAPTPVNLAVDDFEDGDTESLIDCSDCTNNISFFINPGAERLSSGTVATGGDAQLGDYYFSLTGTTKEDNSTLLGMRLFLNTSSSTGTNAYDAKYLQFDYRLNADQDCLLYISIYNANDGISIYRYPVLTNDNTWHSFSLDFASFDIASGHTYDEITSDIDRIILGIRSVSGANPTTDVYAELSLDNIYIVENE